MMKHPLMQIPQITFVTMSDITENFVEFNEVVYNPTLSYDDRVASLQSIIKRRFNKTIPYAFAQAIASETTDMVSVADCLRTFLGYDD